MPVTPSINKEEFRRAFMIQANVIFNEQQRLNKLTVLKDENYRESGSHQADHLKYLQ